MLLRKQAPPPTTDSSHGDYFVDSTGLAAFKIDGVPTSMHRGEPVALEETTAPDAAVGVAKLFALAATGAQLASRNSAGDVAQITAAGAINAVAEPGSFWTYPPAQSVTISALPIVGNAVVVVPLGFDLVAPPGVPVGIYWSGTLFINFSPMGVGAARFSGMVVLSGGGGDQAARYVASNTSTLSFPFGTDFYVIGDAFNAAELHFDFTGSPATGFLWLAIAVSEPFELLAV